MNHPASNRCHSASHLVTLWSKGLPWSLFPLRHAADINLPLSLAERAGVRSNPSVPRSAHGPKPHEPSRPQTDAVRHRMFIAPRKPTKHRCHSASHLAYHHDITVRYLTASANYYYFFYKHTIPNRIALWSKVLPLSLFPLRHAADINLPLSLAERAGVRSNTSGPMVSLDPKPHEPSALKPMPLGIACL